MLSRFRSLFIAFVTACAIFPAGVLAQGVGLSTTDARFDFTLPPGSNQDGQTYVVNQSGDLALPVHIQFSIWNLKDNAEEIEFIQADGTLDAARWFAAQPVDFLLEPRASKKIPFSLRVPSDAPAGTYLVMMRFQPTLPEHYFTEEGPRFIPEVGILFFINVKPLVLDSSQSGFNATIENLKPGNARRLALLEALIPSVHASVFDEAVGTLLASIKNTGTYFFKSSGTIEIKNLLGQTVAAAPLPEHYLLPNRTRTFSFNVLPPPPTGGRFESFRRLVYDLSQQTYLGPYTATLRLKVPGGEDVVSTVGFWIIPWKFWLSILFFSIILVTIISPLRRRLRPALSALTRREP